MPPLFPLLGPCSSLHCTRRVSSLYLCCVQMSKKESVMSGVLPEKMMSEVGILLEQESSSLEGLQDKLKILLEEWSKQTEVRVHVCVCVYQWQIRGGGGGGGGRGPMPPSVKPSRISEQGYKLYNTSQL